MVAKKNLIPLLAIAFIVAILCTGVFYGLLVGKFQSVEASTRSRSIVVAAKSLDRGAVLQEDDVKLAPGPDNRPKDAFSAPEEIKGLTLLQPLREGEPVVRAQVATASGLASGIPNGMRAVSIRVVDAPGVTGLLRPGHKVDIQYVGFPTAASSGDLELRTILQDVEVLAINPQQENLPNRAGVVVVTLLARPDQADLLSLADTSGRLRLLLRNPADRTQEGRSAFALATLLRGVAAPKPVAIAPQRVSAVPASRAATPEAEEAPEVSFSVQVLGVKEAAVGEFLGSLGKLEEGGVMQVEPLRPDANLTALLHSLKDRHVADVLSASRLRSRANRPVSLQASAGSASDKSAGRLRIQFRPVTEAAGRLRVHVQPEIVIPRGGSITRNEVQSELDLSAGQSFLVAGLNGPGVRTLLGKLFPTPADAVAPREVLVVVTPEIVHPGHSR